MRFTLTHFSIPALAAAGALLVGGAAPASANVVESFDYSTGSLSGQSGGSGWASPGSWSGDGSVTSSGFTDSRVPGGAAGEKATVDADTSDLQATRKLSTSQSDTFWLSFIGQHQNPGAGFVQLGLSDGTNNQVKIGSNQGDEEWELLGGGSQLSGAASTDETFLLAKVDVGNGNASLWTNPSGSDITNNTLGTADASVSVSGSYNTIDTVSLEADGHGSNPSRRETLNADEIRIGDSLSAVAVPAPGALPAGLALLGGMAMIRRRRKA